jgi:hypothetical protein
MWIDFQSRMMTSRTGSGDQIAQKHSQIELFEPGTRATLLNPRSAPGATLTSRDDSEWTNISQTPSDWQKYN